MAERERGAVMEINFYLSEVIDIAKASGVKLRMYPCNGWDFDSVEDEAKMKQFIVDAVVKKAREKT